jgi:uncharacterized protein YjbJ (UPF0337 family)
MAGEKDKVEGKAKEVAGSVREKFGEMTGNEETEARGTVQKHEGKGQQTVGKVKGKAKDIEEDTKAEIRKRT